MIVRYKKNLFTRVKTRVAKMGRLESFDGLFTPVNQNMQEWLYGFIWL